MWTAVLPVYDRLNLSFRLITSPKERTLLYQLFKSNLGKSYEVTFSKYHTLDANHVTISKMWTAVLPV